MPQTQDNKISKAAIISAIVGSVAFLAALGTGFQNAVAVAQLLINSTLLVTQHAWILGIAVGGICSTIVNYCINVQLLESFWERISGKKPGPHLPGIGTKLQYGIGIFVFIVTGILFGLTALSVGATGGIAIAAVAAGVFVALVTIPQELETWLESFDDPVAVEIGKKLYDVANEKNEDKIPELINHDFQKGLQRITLKTGLERIKTSLMLQQSWGPKAAELKPLNDAIALLADSKNDISASDLEQMLQAQIANQTFKAGKMAFSSLQVKLAAQKTAFKSMGGQTKEEICKLLNELKKAAEEDQPQIGFWEGLKKWGLGLTFARFVGLIISLGNVMALSLLFTIGLASFLVSLGVAAFPALIVGFCVAFTFGAFTEFYFYHYFLADFCDQIEQRWHDLIHSPNWGLGVLTVFINGAVNGILGYFGVLVLSGLFLSAGIAVPSLFALALTAGIFAGVASLLLGSEFWIKNAESFAKWVAKIGQPNHVEDGKGGYTVLVDELEEIEQVQQGQRLLSPGKLQPEVVCTSKDDVKLVGLPYYSAT